MNIYESSVDYFSNDAVLVFDGETPTEQEVIDYVKLNFSKIASEITIMPSEEYNGLVNPGIITCNLS